MILEDYGALVKFRQQINEIGNTVNDPDLFENIKEACLEKRAFLFSESTSFAVLSFKHVSLFVWVAGSAMSNGMANYLPTFEQMGRDVGSTYIEFWSIRKGFFKLLPPLGWTHIQSEWNGIPITVWSKTL